MRGNLLYNLIPLNSNARVEMAGLIDEIQRDSINGSIKVELILRKMKIAAMKLQLESIENWVEFELNGYREHVPKYRLLIGEPLGWHPNSGWMPIYFQDANTMDLISRVEIMQSVSVLGELIERDSNEYFSYILPPKAVSVLNEVLDHEIPRAAIRISRGSVLSILNEVRNMCLSWALEMERRGILGEGISFDQKELKMAHRAMTEINISHLGSFVGNMGSQNSSRDIISHNNDLIYKIEKFIKLLEMNKDELIKSGVSDTKIEIAIENMKSEILSDNPNIGNIRNIASEIRSIISGAAGNMLAEGAISMINAIIGS